KMRVIPTFSAITPERIGIIPCCWSLPPDPGKALGDRYSLELDLDIDAGSKVELHQRIDRLGRRVHDIEQALVGAHLKLLAAFLVDVRRAVHGEFLDLGRQRNRPAHLRTRTLGRRHDFARRGIEDTVVEGFQPDSNVLTVHFVYRRTDDRRWTPPHGHSST